MRYKCIGNPHCLKTFEHGPSLRAHIASCETAQKMLKSKSAVEKLEHDVGVNYSGIYGLHANPHYPIAHNLDKTIRFHFTDKHKFNSLKKPEDNVPKRLRKSVESTVHSSSQVKNLLNYQQD